MDKKAALSADELELISGGREVDEGQEPNGVVKECPVCGETAIQIPVMGGRYKCDACGVTYSPSLSSMNDGK